MLDRAVLSMIFGPRTVGSDSKVRAKRLKYVTFCNEVGALPLRCGRQTLALTGKTLSIFVKLGAAGVLLGRDRERLELRWTSFAAPLARARRGSVYLGG